MLTRTALPETPQAQPFWELGGRPPRQTLPNRFPLSTHQPPVAGSDEGYSPELRSSLYPLAVSNAAHSSLQSNMETETMLPWKPNAKPGGSDDNILAVTTAAPGSPPTPGHFMASRGDALLLNTMDQQRSSTQGWMQRATATGHEIWGDVADEDWEPETMGVDAAWGSEEADGADAIDAEAPMDSTEVLME